MHVVSRSLRWQRVGYGANRSPGKTGCTVCYITHGYTYYVEVLAGSSVQVVVGSAFTMDIGRKPTVKEQRQYLLPPLVVNELIPQYLLAVFFCITRRSFAEHNVLNSALPTGCFRTHDRLEGRIRPPAVSQIADHSKTGKTAFKSSREVFKTRIKF